MGIPEDEGSNPRMALRRYVNRIFAVLKVIKFLESILEPISFDPKVALSANA